MPTAIKTPLRGTLRQAEHRYNGIILVAAAYMMEKQGDERIARWAASYKALADKIVAHQVGAMQEEFPDEKFPVSPTYRKAMYHRLMVIVDELNWKMDKLLEESPDETDAALKEQLMALQESYEQEFIRQVRKEDPNNVIKA